MNAAIELNNISKRVRRRQILEGVNLVVDQSEICALVGENGAGKSTLIRIILGLTKPSAGSISLFGERTRSGLRSARSKVGYVPDSCAAYLGLSARRNLEARCAEWGLNADEEIDRVLDLVGLDIRDKRPVKQYSLGMKRRLDIAVALLGNTKMLIFDEPANGLDPLGIDSIWSLIRHINQKDGKTILISSHDLDELSSVATHYAFIHQGVLLEKVSRDDLARAGETLKDHYRALVEGDETV